LGIFCSRGTPLGEVHIKRLKINNVKNCNMIQNHFGYRDWYVIAEQPASAPDVLPYAWC
jgi:hypothetical protein